MNSFARGFLRIFSRPLWNWHPLGSEKDLREIIAQGEEEGIITEDEEEMISSIFEIGDTLVEEVMVPRVDIACVDIDTPLEALIRIFAEKGYSRIPVYEDTPDNIVGIIYMSEMFKFWGVHNDLRAVEFVRLPYFVPSSKRVLDTIREFQAKRVSIAMVVDEYGGVCGMVTMEDLLEEIVGELQDELDLEEAPYLTLKDGSIVVDGRMDLEELNELLGTKLEAEDAHTISGLIFGRLERIPQKGELFAFDSLRLQVLEASKQRIHRVLIKKERDTGAENRS